LAADMSGPGLIDPVVGSMMIPAPHPAKAAVW
jgi:hypothetical protein